MDKDLDLGERIFFFLMHVGCYVAIIAVIGMFAVQYFYGEDLAIYRQEQLRKIDAARHTTVPAKTEE